MPSKAMLENFWTCWAKIGKENREKLNRPKNAQFWSLKTWGPPAHPPPPPIRNYIYVSGPKSGVLAFLLHTNSMLKLLITSAANHA